MRNQYVSISLPKEIMNIIDATIKGKGYSSRAEYVKYLVRKDLGGAFS